jgi:hypothetical protein
MAVACSVLFLFRPILLELGDAIRVDGASVSDVLPMEVTFTDYRTVRVSVELDSQNLGTLCCCSHIDRCVSRLIIS